MSTDLKELEKRMTGAMDALKKDFAGLRTGRASVNLLDPVMVEAYGQRMPLNQVGTVSAPESRMLSVSVWDKSLVTPTAKAIRDAGLGLNPQPDGQLIRIPLPELTSERRNELAKLAHKYAEQGRVAVRNVRRDGMEALKKAEKDTRSRRTSTARSPTRCRSSPTATSSRSTRRWRTRKKRSRRSDVDSAAARKS